MIVQPFANYAEALDFAVAETFRAMSALALGDVEGARVLLETCAQARALADRMYEDACR